MIERLRDGFDQLTDRGTDVQSLDDIGNRSVAPRPRPATVVRVVMAVLVVSGGSLVLLGIGTQPSLAADLTASDVSVTTEDGEITALYINPSLTVTWSGLEQSFDTMSAYIYISNTSSDRKSEGESIYRSICDDGDPNPADCGEKSGNYTFEYGNENIDLLNASSYFGSTVEHPPINASVFSAAEGETETTTVYVLVEVTVFSDGVGFNSVEKELSFDVTVTNEAANMSAGGALNTSVEG